MSRKTTMEAICFASVFACLVCCLTGEVTAQSQGQMPEEIEVAPGVWVPSDMWEDDYVPTCQEMTDAGFIESDAQIIASRQCSWSEIKACFMGYYNDCCPKKADE